MVNTIAPYILTGLIGKPRRLIYLSSNLHQYGRANLENFKKDSNRVSYSDSKLPVVMLCMAVARKSSVAKCYLTNVRSGFAWVVAATIRR